MFNISKSWRPVAPPNAAAAGFPVTPPPPVEVSRRAAAAGSKHPARRRRQNDVGLGLYFQPLLAFTTGHILTKVRAISDQ